VVNQPSDWRGVEAEEIADTKLHHIKGLALHMNRNERRQAKEIDKRLMLCSSTARLPALLNETCTVSDAVFWDLFFQFWSVCDGTWEDSEELLHQLQDRFAPDFSPAKVGSTGNKIFFQMLTDPMLVYRGCSRERVYGLSWTTDIDVARVFAGGHRSLVPDPVVAEANIYKRHIFAIFGDRKESEILLNSDWLVDIKISPFKVAGSE
jgi:hypothetical protein